jgi:hypothetical protein
MSSPETSRGMIVLVLALIGAAAWAGEPNDTPIHVQIEISPTAIAPTPLSRLGSSLWIHFAQRKPAYVAAIPLMGEREFLPSPRELSMQGFLQFARQEGGLSEKQELFVEGMFGMFNNPLILYRVDPSGPEFLWLYAVTQEDARKMVQAYVQYATREFRRRVAAAENQIRNATKNIEDAQKQIADLEQRSEAARQSLEELQKTVPYRTESEAHEAIVELDRMRNTAQVEIAGIVAKMDRIEGYRQQPPRKLELPPDAAARLGMMLVEEDIALQGAAAREKRATTLREQASRFVDLASTLAKAPGEKESLTKTLGVARQDFSLWQGNLASLKRKEPKIPPRVVIYPVQWEDEPSQN